MGTECFANRESSHFFLYVDTDNRGSTKFLSYQRIDLSLWAWDENRYIDVISILFRFLSKVCRWCILMVHSLYIYANVDMLKKRP